MEYLCFNDNDNTNKSSEDNVPCKKHKLNEHSETVGNLINDWISEYKIWYGITFGQINSAGSKSSSANDLSIPIQSNLSSNVRKPPCLNIPINQEDFTFSSSGNQGMITTNNIQLGNINQNYIFHQLRNNKTHNMGYWGPLLRYGTYGVHKRYPTEIGLNNCTQILHDFVKQSESFKHAVTYPLDVPLRIKIPRQAMLCTLQSKMRPRLNDLRKMEADPDRHMNINYAQNLELVTKQCGTCPKYLYTKINQLPPNERAYFTNSRPNHEQQTYLSLDGSTKINIASTNDFYACELLIGDIIISQGFALWKRRARELCAKIAFSVLENPCFFVGSTRFWYGTDYMTACITTDPSIAPILPPFLTDPTEPLFKKDERINESDPDENFDIPNPKSKSDFWIYVTTLDSMDNIKNIDPTLLLYQSAEFSQMNLSFEVETCWDQSFACTVMLDKTPVVKVEGLRSLEQAHQVAALVLVDRLVDSQPVIVLDKIHHEQYLTLPNHRNNSFIVRSLMWGSQHQMKSPIDFCNLSTIIKEESISSPYKLQNISSRDRISNEADLEHFLALYAQSSLMCPMRIDNLCVSEDLWPGLSMKIRKTGLIVENEVTDGVIHSMIICKQVPHTRLKALLMRDKRFGPFVMLSDGNLPQSYLDSLNEYIRYDDNSVSDEDFCDQYSIFATDSDTANIPNDSIPGLDF